MSEKRQARFEQLRETSMERIRSAAMELFARNGYGNTSISQIATAAGVSKGLMYNYYESKEALLRAIVQQGFDLGEDMLEDSMAKANGPEDLLKLLVDASFSEILKKPEYWKLMTSLALQEDVMKTVAPEVEAKRREMLEFGKNLYEQLGFENPMEQAMLFAATMDGVMLHYILSPQDYPVETVKQLLIDTFCKKVTPASAGET
jgi:AcrR family transcriptional regulator